MEGINAVLGSSVVVAIITAMFQWAQSKKNAIINSNKASKKKLREISFGIHNCKYEDKNEKNIEKYLLQLQMIINPYGKNTVNDYIQDGYVWEVIKKYKRANVKKNLKRIKSYCFITYL